MNKIHRIVWSAVRGAFVVAHEFANAHGKPSSTRKAGTVAAAVAATVAGLLAAAPAAAAPPAPNTLPTGGQVAAGVASIGQNGNRMDIVQSSQKAVWASRIGDNPFANPLNGKDQDSSLEKNRLWLTAKKFF